jgi:hypothetical protein
MLGSQLGLSPSQANGGVGSILSYAQGKLPPADFDKVAATIRVEKILPPPPARSQINLDFTSAFSKLGISPEQANQLIPAVTQYVSKVGWSAGRPATRRPVPPLRLAARRFFT